MLNLVSRRATALATQPGRLQQPGRAHLLPGGLHSWRGGPLRQRVGARGQLRDCMAGHEPLRQPGRQLRVQPLVVLPQRLCDRCVHGLLRFDGWGV